MLFRSRERALTEDESPLHHRLYRSYESSRRRTRRRQAWMFFFGIVVGAVALFAALWVAASRVG